VQHVTFTEPDADHPVEEWVFLDYGKESREAFTMKESALNGAVRTPRHSQRTRMSGAPSITVSALSRDTLSDRVARLLRSSRVVSGFDLPFVEGFGFGVALGVAFAFCSCDQGPLSESCDGSLVPPTIYPVTYFRS
jgi:hypothetical protein